MFNGEIVPRRTMRKITADELVRKSEVNKRAGFDAAIKHWYGDYFTMPAPCKPNTQDTDINYDLNFDERAPMVPEADIVDEQGALLHPASMADALMNAEVLLPQGEYMRLERVIRRSVDSDGKVIGKNNEIKILNTILYDMNFPDCAVKPYADNIIVENILNQVDEDRYQNQIINTILDHSKDS